MEIVLACCFTKQATFWPHLVSRLAAWQAWPGCQAADRAETWRSAFSPEPYSRLSVLKTVSRNSQGMEQIHLRQPPKRLLFALVGVLIFGVLLFQFSIPSNPQPGSASWGSATPPAGLMGDIYNSTLGVSCVRIVSWLIHPTNNHAQYEKIFVVGLPSRSDRRDTMVLQAALSDIQIEFIDGVMGKDVPNKAIPMERGKERQLNATIGSWRAHMNAIRE